MIDLVKLKQDVLEYCDKHEINGGKVLTYKCPHCNSELKATVPKDEGESWDSLTTCYECGKIYWVVKTISSVEASEIEG